MTVRCRSLEELPEIHLAPEYALHPGRVIAQARKEHGPIFRTTDYTGERRIFVVGPEANRTVMTAHHACFSNREGWSRTDTVVETLGPGLIFLDGLEHERLRAAAAPAFSPIAVASYVPTMNRIIADRVADWRDGTVIDLYEETYRMTFEIAAVLLIGLERGPTIERLSSLFHQLVTLNVPDLEAAGSKPGSAASRRRELKSELCDLLRPSIARQRREGSESALARLARSRDDEGRQPNDEELLAHANGFLLAGHITTSSLCAFLMHRLARDEHHRDRITSEQRCLRVRAPDIGHDAIAAMTTLERAVKEAERLFPPVPTLPRGVTEDVVFHGYLIPRGETVFCSIAGSHMSDDLFSDPDEFDPDRFAPGRAEHHANPLALVGFGAGPRRCLGVTMANVEMKLIVAQVLGRFTLERLPGSEAVTLYHPILTPLGGLKVRLNAS